MRKIKKIIFILLLVFLFTVDIKADSNEWFVCTVTDSNNTNKKYSVVYDTDGNAISTFSNEILDEKEIPIYIAAEDDSQIRSFIKSNFQVDIYTLGSSNIITEMKIKSNVSPTNKNECPESDKAKFHINFGYVEIVAEEGTQSSADLGGCNNYTFELSCRTNKYYACVWNETKYGDYCNVDELLYVKCGDAKDIPYQVPGIISFAVNFLKILTPIILIVVSVISLLKALSASNEDEIKKAQKGLIRKIIAAVLVFFVITIVQFVIMKVADSEIKSDENGKVETTNLSDCLNCLLNNKCQETVYYKTYSGSTLTETPVTKINK